jgi:fructosamine-3-kinase
MFNDYSFLALKISEQTGELFELINIKPLSGGDINTALCLQGQKRRYFAKINRAQLVNMFAAEYKGLQEIAATQTINVPKAISYGTHNHYSFLILDYIDVGNSNKHLQRLLGQQLAQLHQQPQPFFGWHCNNTIGSTPQINTANNNWLAFWQTQRLGFQLNLAFKNGYKGKLQQLGAQLIAKMPALFADYQPVPSLLHGDLWGGNYAINTQGQPFIFDPACYYGDRETDIAMTELFGGFSSDFYNAYNEVWALDTGYTQRKPFYNLYHLLNHLNLFGSSYLRQTEQTIMQLLSALH